MTRLARHVEERYRKVAEQSAINDARVCPILILLVHGYKEKRNARAHTYCQRNIEIVGIDAILKRILWQAQHAARCNIRGNHCETIAKAGILWLILSAWNDQVSELAFFLCLQMLTHELLDVTSAVDATAREQIESFSQKEPVKPRSLAKRRKSRLLMIVYSSPAE